MATSSSSVSVWEDGVYAANTAYMIIATALVGLMTPALAFFYGGLVRKKNVLTMMMQNYITMGLIYAIWYLVGFSLCFGPDAGHFIGKPGYFAFFRHLNDKPMTLDDGTVYVSTIPGLLFACYQAQFAVICPALMTGAFADRMRFRPYLIFISLWFFVVYAPWAHALWGPSGWAYNWGAVDFAGGVVIHVTAGFSAIATVIFLGERKVLPGENKAQMHVPHNVPFVALGTGLLWFGWYGFNGGSALAANKTAMYASVNSETAAAMALFVWLILEKIFDGKPSLVGLCVGAIAGLATITPAAGFVAPWGAFIIGCMASCVCFGCVKLIKMMKLDDALDVIGVHGVGGFLGTCMVGILADPDVNPGYSITASPKQFGKQLAVATTCAVYSIFFTFMLLKLISLVMPILPKDTHLMQGLDVSFHGWAAYVDEDVDSSKTGLKVVKPVKKLEEESKDAPESTVAARTVDESGKSGVSFSNVNEAIV